MRWAIGAILISSLLATACTEGNWPEEPESIVGDCEAGTTLQAGEGCIIANPEAEESFWVNQDGIGCYSIREGGAVYRSITRCANYPLNEDAITVVQNADGSWTVIGVP